MSQAKRLEMTAARLAELGHPTRLAIFKELVKAGHEGSPVGRVQERLGIPASTLSHHLGKMVKVGLVEQRRESRTLYCVPCFDALNGVIDFLREECCIDEG